jgi:hypothetical protein
MMPEADRAVLRGTHTITPANLDDLSHIRMRWHGNAMRATGVVYYLLRSDGNVKIGCTANYPQRRNDLVRRHGYLKLLAWELGYYPLETQRHQQFAHLRIDPIAEWFLPGPDLRDHLLTLRGVLGAPVGVETDR